MGEKTKLQEMLEKKEKIRQGGGEKKVAKQHGAGKLTARERIDLLFDPGTFQEYNIFMKHRCHDFGMEKVDTPAEGVVTGYGLIHGRGAFAFAHDFTVLGGAMGEMQGMKVKRIQELAMDAGVPLKRPVSGVAMGLIQEEGKTVVLTDIQGLEDFLGDMDFKVTGTTKGITAMQMDNKATGLTPEILRSALMQAHEGRMFILDAMLDAVPAVRAETKESAPQIISLQIPTDKIRDVIGSGGKVIQKICADTGAKIDIEDDGTIYIAGTDKASCDAAKKTIETIVFVPEVGQLYYGKVVRILQFGAFVELAPGKDGMVHISKLADRRVEKVEDVVNIGDMIWVKVTDIDEKGRVNLSYRDALKEIKAKKEAGEPIK